MAVLPRRYASSRAAWIVLLALAWRCGDAPTGTPVFQLYTTEAFPQTAGCGGFPVEWTFRMHLVNTLAQDVTVDSVGLRGVVRNATSQTVVGRSVYVHSSIGFMPTPALVRASDGDVTIDSMVNTACFNYEGVHNGDFANVDMTLLVYTSAGLFPSRPINIVHTWTF